MAHFSAPGWLLAAIGGAILGSHRTASREWRSWSRAETFSRQGAEAQRPPSTPPVMRPLRPASRTRPVVGVARCSERTAQRLLHLSSARDLGGHSDPCDPCDQWHLSVRSSASAPHAPLREMVRDKWITRFNPFGTTWLFALPRCHPVSRGDASRCLRSLADFGSRDPRDRSSGLNGRADKGCRRAEDVLTPRRRGAETFKHTAGVASAA